MKKLLLVLALISSIIVVAACGANSDNVGEASNNVDSEKQSNEDKKKPKSWEFVWNAPEGFSSDDGETYVTDDYPNDTSNITYTSSEDDGKGINFTSKEFETVLEDTYSKLGMEIDVVVDRFEKIEKNGCVGLVIESNYSLNNVKLIQLQYAYQVGEKIHTVCYTAVGDTWLEVFKENAKSITITPIYD